MPHAVVMSSSLRLGCLGCGLLELDSAVFLNRGVFDGLDLALETAELGCSLSIALARRQHRPEDDNTTVVATASSVRCLS